MVNGQATSPYLSIVIPAYNEGGRLGRALAQVRDYVERRRADAEVIVVDDGSSDDTAAVVQRFDAQGMPLRLLRNEVNRGKGYSVRRGMLEARGQVLLMTDADQSTPIWELEKLLPHVRCGCQVVIGSRDMPDSLVSVEQGFCRRMMGKALRVVRGWIMLRDIRDTQCGFKLFTRQAAREIFARQAIDGFAFDCEVLLLARKLGCCIKEVGVVWCNDPDSRVRPIRDSLGMMASLIRLRWRYR